jgi:hypothetical protein
VTTFDPSLNEEPDRLDATLAAVVNGRTKDALYLLPGALILLAFHILVIWSGAIGRVQPTSQPVFALSLASVALSSLLFAVLARGTPLRTHRLDSGLRAAVLLFTTGMGAMALGLAGDFFVLGTQLSRSPTAGELLAGLVLLLLYAPWL